MKYINQLNILMAVAGAALVIYFFSQTYWSPEPEQPLNVARTPASTVSPAGSSAPPPASPSPLQSRETRRPAGQESRRVTPPAPESGEEEVPGEIPAPSPAAPQSEGPTIIQSGPSPSASSPPPSAPAPSVIPQNTPEAGSDQTQRPRRTRRPSIIPPRRGAETEKRDPGDVPPPPVRSSMRGQRPPR